MRTQSQSSVDLSIVIVSWNVRVLLGECLQSIADTRGDLMLEVIVVDSASADDSPQMVREKFPWVRLIASQENLGFPRGNNAGIKLAGGHYILLLNPDTIVLRDALQRMLSHMQAHNDVGALGAQLLNSDLTIQSSRRRFPTVATGIFESTWLQPLAPSSVLARYYASDLADDQIADVDWVTGACLMVPRHVIDKVGLLDEAYFMYSEEMDWCRRIKDAGYRVIYFPQSQIVHHVGQSSDQATTARHINFQQAKLRYFRKFHGPLVASGLRMFLLSSYLLQIAVESLKGLLGHKRPLRRQRVQTYWRVVRSGLRPAGY